MDPLQQEEPMDFIQVDSYAETQPKQTSTESIQVSGNIFSVFLGLKVAQFGIYMFGWILIPWTIFQWVATIIASAIDFWFTKNVAGRLILGMRWSNRVNQDGESSWVFEFASERPDAGGKRRTFWMALYGSTAVWALFAFFSLIRLNFGWFFVTIIAFALACSNTWGFMKCDRSIKNDASRMLTGSILPFFSDKLSSTARNIVFNAAAGQVLQA